jgi:hypothetical protein
MSEIPQDVRDLAAGITRDIETHGHFQDPFAAHESPHWYPQPLSWGSHGPDKPCCVVYSPTGWRHYRNGDETWQEFRQLLVGRDGEIPMWNDYTPTAEVLATLRKIAAGERP